VALRIGPLAASHRAALEALVRETGMFSAAETAVALELFDAGVGVAGAAPEDPDYELHGAFRDGALVGFVCFGPTPCTDGTWDLYWIAVAVSAQRQGVGAALLDHVQSVLRSRGARLLVIETSSRIDYEGPRRFYERHGFVELARLADFYGPRDDRLVQGQLLGTRKEEAGVRKEGRDKP
jgi:ribosomal protein S18 acetylase RimI-like enzyme